MSNRINAKFQALKQQGRAALVTFISAGDPDLETSAQLLHMLPKAGADIIELGMPFSDPMADGPAVQASSERALKAGASLAKTLDMVQKFRQSDQETPIILMGYYNPIYAYGVAPFLERAQAVGVDGFIVVDLSTESDHEFCLPALDKGLSFIRLAAPTTNDQRLPSVIKNTSGFVYFVSIAGITGTKSANQQEVAGHIARIRKLTDLPVAVGFGIKTPEQAASFAQVGDAVVVGSAIVDMVKASLDQDMKAQPQLVTRVQELVQALSTAVASVKK